jgi:hypothetical protein
MDQPFRPRCCARELLHDADYAHRHGILRERERVLAADRNVQQTQLQLGVGQLPRGDLRLLGSPNTCFLRVEQRLGSQRNPHRLV